MTDPEYRQIMQKSKAEGQRALFDEYFGYVFSIVYSRLKSCASREDIDECVSDIFSDIFIHCDSGSSFDGDLKGFIGTVANRKAINMFHRLSSERSRSVPADEDELSRIPDDTDVQEIAERSEMQRILLTTIGELGVPDSVIIMRKYYSNMTAKEIAAEVSLSPAAVRVRCSRALKRLRKMLSEKNITLKES